ncbi:lipocalin family protein [Methylophilus sp. 5]|uniref:lipocalin family protein n=1 Tax=Methylophilus sp. 5 TaxID=1112274 RepID=UPI00048B32A8
MPVIRLSALLYPLLALMLSACSEPLPAQAEQAVVRRFDPSQYVGTWYEIARLDNRFEKGLEQVTANYSLEADGTLKVVNRGFSPDKNDWSEAIGKAKFVDPPNADGSRTGRLKVSFFGPFYGDYTLLDIDQPYYNYALVSSGRDYLWILSRTPQLTYPIKQHLMAKAKELGFATDQLLFIRQSNQVEYESGRHVMPQHH